MRSVLAAASCLLLMALPGCSPAAEHPPGPVSAPAVTPATGDVSAPAGLPPLWPPAGMKLLGGEPEGSPAYAYQPVQIEGALVQPVEMPGGTYYYRQQDDSVYLIAQPSARNGYTALPAPVLLYRLPLKEGDQWLMGAETYRVAAFESQVTPAGTQLAARIEVKAPKSSRTEWWVPGYGLVRLERPGREPWTASGERRELPQPAPAVGRPAPGTVAILQDNEREWFVTSEGKDLFRVSDFNGRSTYHWRRAGDTDLLSHTLYSGNVGLFRYEALRLDGGSFVPVSWLYGGQAHASVAGEGEWKEDAAFTLTDRTTYPTRHYTFRFDGKAMVSDPSQERAEYAGSAYELALRMANPLGMSKADMLAIFTDPKQGRLAAEIIHGQFGYNVRMVSGASDQFDVVTGADRFVARLTFTQVDGQWKVSDLTTD